MATILTLVLLLIFGSLGGEGGGSMDMMGRVVRRLEELGLSQEDISSLPESSRETRESSCPGVREDVVTYTLHLEDGMEPSSLDLQQVVIHKTSHATYAAKVLTKPWLSGEVHVKPHLNCLAWDSEELVGEVKASIKPPSTLPYNFSVPLEELAITSLEGEVGQPKEVDALVFGGKLKGGFFLEAGSHDSETNSDSLYWEMTHGWTGLLVEPNPLTHQLGLEKQRKAHSLQTCLSTETSPATLQFAPMGSYWNSTTRESMSGLVPNPITEGDHKTFAMQCMPLYTILLALGNPTVHHFTLDVEGAELPVLRTIPWTKVDIQALSVETHLAGLVFPGDRAELIAYMESVGYTHLPHAHRATNALRTEKGTTDDLFVRSDLPLADANLPKEEL